jgi:hypothetical protein
MRLKANLQLIIDNFKAIAVGAMTFFYGFVLLILLLLGLWA